MKKVTTSGKKYIHLFQREADNVLIEQEITANEYFALGLKDAGQPTMDGCKWILSEERVKYDTPTGDLGDEEYAEVDGMYHAKKTGFRAMTFEKSDFIGHDIKDVIKQKKLIPKHVDDVRERVWQ